MTHAYYRYADCDTVLGQWKKLSFRQRLVLLSFGRVKPVVDNIGWWMGKQMKEKVFLTHRYCQLCIENECQVCL